jgi:hypothetical protein
VVGPTEWAVERDRELGGARLGQGREVFVSERIGLEDVEDAFRKMQRGQVLRSVVVMT